MTEDDVHALDRAVQTAAADLGRRGIAEPDALLLMGTGVGLLPGRLRSATRLPLEKVAGVPAAWGHVMLHAGELDGARVLLIEDAPGPPEEGTGSSAAEEAPWTRGFPCWLAAAAGAGILVHTSAGVALPLPPETSADALPAIEPGSLALLTDHLNLSGRTPLVGLGDSRLGPLFPDLSRLHHATLRARALEIAAARGIRAAPTVGACTIGPSLETQAERAWLGRTGARVAVQGLADPLLAAGHAGLACLAIVCVTDDGAGAQGIASQLARAELLAPALEEILAALAPDLAAAADAQFVEE